MFYLPSGYARRLVLLRLRPGSADAFAAIAKRVEAANPRMSILKKIA